ncbi:MAG: hypothetical protein LPK45_10260 [Bacteroidota bacterium]|nr:hypothetical protein [Bacteroidota bacterium]MDX5431480.1 hypothetical protein [Bacteroidota bacterium]MDX5470204.1 hypothetical protein [Bacteroidota bacterium]
MKKAIFLFAVVFGLGTIAQAQVVSPDQVVELKSSELTPSRGDNPNIKGQKPTEDVLPEKKATRGSYTCDLKLENWSDYCIDVYVDGYYKCTLSSKSYMYVVADLGYSSIYAESCGKTRYWSKQGISCDDRYTYRFY